MPDRALVIGAGLTGCTIARTLADAGVNVTLVEKGATVGGMCADHSDPYGNLVQTFGPHIFHTNDQSVWDFVHRFTCIQPYRHKVLARYNGGLYPFPVNRNTIERINIGVADKEHTPTGPEPDTNAQDWLNWRLGEVLTKMFFAGYSSKQWGVPLSEIPAWVVKRVAPRDDRNDDFFLDTYQGLPKDGYTAMLTEMVSHEKIQCRFYYSVNTYLAVSEIFYEKCPVVHTGPLDVFAASYDSLHYRKIAFTYVNVPARDFNLPAASINECDPFGDYTRVTDNGIFSAYQRPPSLFTTLTYEQPWEGGDVGETKLFTIHIR
jgi:UDP-galactopyranose mutase